MLRLGSSLRYKSFFADLAVIFLHIISPPKLGQQLPPLHAQWTGFGEELLKKGILGQNEGGIHLDLATGGNNSREIASHFFPFSNKGNHKPCPPFSSCRPASYEI